jgi:beta-lactamase regulating signal transducer with metallopeptidase domain
MSITLSIPADATFAVEMTAKATLVLLAAAAAAGVVALRGGSAAARHLVWTLGVCGVLALPLLSATLPGWRTPLLTIPTARAAAPATFAGDPVIARPVGNAATSVTPSAPAAADPVITRASRGVAANGMGLGTGAVLVYLLGVLAVLGRLAVGRWSVARLGRQAERVEDAAWTGLLRDLAWELGITRPVRLLRGGGTTMPMTWGIAHPAVLLPAESAEWPEERRRVVLMHELAHVARHDCLTQTLAAAACALYWFHPAAWYAARRLRVERELACDDRVLQAGTRARDYAAHLLEVARAFRPAPLAGPVAVSMARPSQLEGRLLAVLDGVRDRRMPGRAAALGAAALALALVLPLAAIRPGSAQQAVPAGVTFGGPKPWRETTKTKPPRSSDAYPDLAAALRQGVVDVTLAARPGERLTLELPDRVNARVEAWNRASVHVRVDDPGLHVRAESVPGGARVTVTGRPRTDGATPHVRIQAPRNYSVHTEADGGGLEIGALNGTFTGSVTNGGLAFRGTRGTVRMVAHGGGAYIENAHLDGRLEMDGGGVLMGGNTGNLDVTGAAATAHGRPGGRLRVDVPGRARSGSDDEEVACAGDACTIAPAHTSGVVIASGSARTTVTTTESGGATTVAVGTGPARSTVRGSGSARATTVTVRGETAGPVYVVDGVAVSGEGRAIAGSTTTIVSGDGETTRDRDGYAYLTGDTDGRIEALRAMARNAPPAAAAASLGRLAFSEDDARVQRAAVEELARLRTRAATRQLGRIARGHPRSAIRAQAAAALR